MRHCFLTWRYLSLGIMCFFSFKAGGPLGAQTVNRNEKVVVTVKTGLNAAVIYDSTAAQTGLKPVGKLFKGEMIEIYRTTPASVWRRVEYNGLKGWVSQSEVQRVDSSSLKPSRGFKSNQVKLFVENDNVFLELEPTYDKEAAVVLLIKNNSILNSDTLYFSKTQTKALTRLNVSEGDTLVFISGNNGFFSFRTSLLELKAILQARPLQETVIVDYGFRENFLKNEKTILIEFQNIKSQAVFPALKFVDSGNKPVGSVADTARGLTTFLYKLNWTEEKSVEKSVYIQLGTATKKIKLTLSRRVKPTAVEISVIIASILIVGAGGVIFAFRKKFKNMFFNRPAKLEQKIIQRIQSVTQKLERLTQSSENAKLADQSASILDEASAGIAYIFQEDFKGIRNKQNLLEELMRLKGVIDELLNKKNGKVKALIKERKPQLQDDQQKLQNKIKDLEPFINQTENQTLETAKADIKDDAEQFINEAESQTSIPTEVVTKKENQAVVAEQITTPIATEAQQGLLNDKFVKIANDITDIKKTIDHFKEIMSVIVKIESLEDSIKSAFKEDVNRISTGVSNDVKNVKTEFEDAIKSAFKKDLDRISMEVSDDLKDVKEAFKEHESNVKTFLTDDSASRKGIEKQREENAALQEKLRVAENKLEQLGQEVSAKTKTIEQVKADNVDLTQRLTVLKEENQNFQQISKYRVKERFLVITEFEKEALKRFQSSLDRLLHLFSDCKESIDRLRQKVGLPAEIFRFNLAPFEALWECVQEMETYGSVYKTDLIRTKLNISSTEMALKFFLDKLYDYSKKGAVVGNLDYFFIGLQKIYHLDKKTDIAANSDVNEALSALKGNDRLIREVVKEWVGLSSEPITLLGAFAEHEKYCKQPPRVVSAKNYYPGVDIKPGTIVDILNWVYRDGEKWNTKAIVYISG